MSERLIAEARKEANRYGERTYERSLLLQLAEALEFHVRKSRPIADMSDEEKGEQYHISNTYGA